MHNAHTTPPHTAASSAAFSSNATMPAIRAAQARMTERGKFSAVPAVQDVVAQAHVPELVLDRSLVAAEVLSTLCAAGFADAADFLERQLRSEACQ